MDVFTWSNDYKLGMRGVSTIFSGSYGKVKTENSKPQKSRFFAGLTRIIFSRRT